MLFGTLSDYILQINNELCNQRVDYKNLSSGIISQNEKLKAYIIEKRRGVNGDREKKEFLLSQEFFIILF